MLEEIIDNVGCEYLGLHFAVHERIIEKTPVKPENTWLC